MKVTYGLQTFTLEKDSYNPNYKIDCCDVVICPKNVDCNNHCCLNDAEQKFVLFKDFKIDK